MRKLHPKRVTQNRVESPAKCPRIPPWLKMSYLNYLENRENVKIMSQISDSKSGRVACKVPSHSSMANLKYWENQAGGSCGTNFGPLRVLCERTHSSMICNSRFFSECTQKPGFRFRADGSLKSMDEFFLTEMWKDLLPFSVVPTIGEGEKSARSAKHSGPFSRWQFFKTSFLIILRYN